VTEQPARSALAAALGNRRRHLLALGVVVAGFAAAAAVDTSVAFYAAGLVAFSVWMLWFVLTTIDWIRHADF
jgi:hypothetical protein